MIRFDLLKDNQSYRMGLAKELYNTRLKGQFNVFTTDGAKIFLGESFHIIKYEDIVLDSESALRPLFDNIGLEYAPEINMPYLLKHHHLAGNDGTVSPQTGKDVRKDGINSIRHNYYKDIKGLQMDNKYKEFFTEDELALLNNGPAFQEYMDLFNYKELW